jgi:aminoglycoside phosphotransferase (APT) family kinase protein
MMEAKPLLNLELIRVKIPLLNEATKIEQITKGFSADKKYIVYIEGTEKYLLRTAAIDQYERKLLEFNMMSEMESCDIHSPRTYEVGKLEELGISYYLLSYIEGEDAKDKLPMYSEQVQYQIGFEAGKDLAKMNLFNAPITCPTWSHHILKKYMRYLEAYKTCGIKLKNDDKIIKFINRNKEYLKHRPNRFQHDDFHVGNIIVRDSKYAGVIDFNRCDWGDPIHDFVKVALFSREISVPFSIGQINGYFDHQIPEDFWQLYSIYVAMNIFSCVVWSKEYTPELLEEMLGRLDMVMDDHDYFERKQPKWFT